MIPGMSTYVSVGTSPATCTCPVVMSVSTATRLRTSPLSMASRIESLIWSAILSGCPSVTDSDVKRRRATAYPFPPPCQVRPGRSCPHSRELSLAELYWCRMSARGGWPASAVQAGELPVMLRPQPGGADPVILARSGRSPPEVVKVSQVGGHAPPKLSLIARMSVAGHHNLDVGQPRQQLQPGQV